LEVDEPNDDDVLFAESRIGIPAPKERITVLKTSNHRYIVVAGRVVISESQMGLFESPFELPPIKQFETSRHRFPEDSMKHILLAVLLLVFTPSVLAQGAPPQGAADQPYTMEYYYKVQWGHQQEFLQLFLKNHYPLLKKIAESGRMLSVKIETPANHMTEDARWDYRVTIRFKNSTVATTANPEEEALIKQLWPDHETYKREEQRRFEILQAHWDLPVTDVTPATK
jgi:hypothetical protein